MDADNQKKMQLQTIKAYQAQFMVENFEKQSKIMREKAEAELLKLSGYVDCLNEINVEMKNDLNDLSELERRKNAAETARLLNKLGSFFDVSGQLDELRCQLSSSQNMLKGVCDSSSKNFAESLEELNTSAEILNQFKTLTSNNKCFTKKIAEKSLQLSHLIKQEIDMVQEIATVVNSVESLALSRNYYIIADDLKENNDIGK